MNDDWPEIRAFSPHLGRDFSQYAMLRCQLRLNRHLSILAAQYIGVELHSQFHMDAWEGFDNDPLEKRFLGVGTQLMNE